MEGVGFRGRGSGGSGFRGLGFRALGLGFRGLGPARQSTGQGLSKWVQLGVIRTGKRKFPCCKSDGFAVYL